MNDFVAEFLQKSHREANDDTANPSDTTDDVSKAAACISTSTHLIALPVDACHELLLELESVQRAILYHCPILVHACIAPAVTRLPLLYVRAPSATAVSTDKLYDIVKKTVADVINQEDAEKTSVEAGDNEVRRDDGTPDTGAANDDNISPLLLSFQGLEIDGTGNNVLSTVANVENENGLLRLQRLVSILRERIHTDTGWDTWLPEDPRLALENDVVADPSFRPHIPFMRLPKNWIDFLETENDDQEVWMLPSEKGGNGISPIFWGQWLDDDFGEARMREVAIYNRQGKEKSLDEKAFYLPARSIPLPEGNAALRKQEAKFEAYNEERILQAEALQRKGTNSANDARDDDPLLSKTRNKLYSLYESSSVPGTETEDSPVLPEQNLVDASKGSDSESFMAPKPQRGNTDELDNWTKDRIRNAIESRAKFRSEIDLAKPKEKPPIQENSVFSKYKEGTLAPTQDQPETTRELPPYPSREHCMGFWRVVSSPTGFEVEEGNDSRSDNIILRVDGTTAGGPILDQETRQKTSGGTWRLMGESKEDAGLLVRLVIPPKKERILVMEGRLERISMSSDLPLASSTFGIPELEARKARSTADIEDLLYCSGNVYIEDAITGQNRDEIGSFSLMKLQTPTDPSKYTITIPKPVRNQD
jgi:hypothetical protein